MHIAICDDNIADRKQLERLIKRESDKRAASTGILYADSFGNAASMLANPMQYDVFYIDICKTEGITGTDVANALVSQGVHAPIVMCCSDIPYRQMSFPENVIFLDKPIRVTELSESIEHALKIKEQAPSLIELREDYNTVYVTEPEILYGIEEGHYVKVTLTDKRTVHAVTSAVNLFAQLEIYPSLILPSPKVLLNGRYIEKLRFHKAFMTDGACFKISLDCMAYTKQIFQQFHGEN